MMHYSSADTAYAYMKKFITDMRTGTLRRLPPVKQLAADAGVAERTMLKAVHRLRDEGIVSVSHGRGIRIVAESMPVIEPSREKVAGPRWQNVAAEIYRHICAGTWSILPSMKELRHTIGTSHPVLKRALTSLEFQAIIKPYKRTFRTVAPAYQSITNTIILISRGIGPSEVAESGMLHDMVWECEQQSSCLGLRLLTVPYTFTGTQMAGFEKLQDACKLNSVLGFIVFAEGIEHGYLSDTYRLLLQSKKPVAVIDRYLAEDVGAGYNNPLLRHFVASTGMLPGRIMARYLLSQGHSRVAYVDDVHSPAWSKARYAGMAAEFATAGKHAHLQRFIPEWIGEPDDLLLLRDCEQIDDRFSRVLDRYNFRSSAYVCAVRHISVMQRNISSVYQGLSILAGIESCLSGIIADGAFTCIAGANDRIALACMGRMREKGFPASSAMSFTGFDNTMESLIYRLTTYSFGIQTLISRMFNFIFRPLAQPGGAAGSLYEEHAGVVIIRDSVAPV
jgi:DNA-binding LacI/PurR family transcriptional regulator/DNA-binding transcriptional regulator YhcF (GntR family)